MHLSKETQEILANFSTINQSIVLKPGKTLATISNAKTILAKADIEDTLEEEFGIYDLNQFLNVLGLFEQPSLDIGDKTVKISEGDEVVNYVKTEPSLIAVPPEEIKFPAGDVKFKVTADELKKLIKTAALLGSPEIVVEGDRENIYIGAQNIKNSGDNVYRFKIDETPHEFKMIFKTENMKMMVRDYEVEISHKGISKWESPGLTYYIAVDQQSTFRE